VNDIQKLAKRLKRQMPNATISLQEPHDPDGIWWLDVTLNDESIAIDWSRAGKFGLSSIPREGFGDAPDEVYSSIGEAMRRVVALLKSGQHTVSPRVLQSLRQSRRLSQERLAALLRVRQAAVSKMERRSDMYLSTLRKVIAAMGGQLEVIARFPDGDVRIASFRSIGSRSSTQPRAPKSSGDVAVSR